MIRLIVFLVIIVYCLLKYYKTKKELMIYAIVLACSLEITQSPFNLPSELALSLWAFLGFGVLLYKIVTKKMERVLYIFSGIFFTFGIIFLLQAFREMGYQNHIIKLLSKSSSNHKFISKNT
jgi:hypothetical protein